MISDYNKKATVTRPDNPTQTAGGGLVAANTNDCFTKSYKVESRSGGLQVDSNQREWNYDYKLTGRYYKSFVEKGGDLIKIGCKTLIVRSVSFDNEGQPKEVILRCSNNE